MGARAITLMLVAASLAVPRPVSARVQDSAMRVRIGEAAPDFRLEDVTSGKEYALSDYKGTQVVLLEFWATWCETCKREMPSLVKLYSEWRPRGVELLSIVLPSGSIDDVRRIVQEKKLPYPVLLDGDLSVATKAYGLAGLIPLKVVIDHRGIVRYVHVGDYPPGMNELPLIFGDLTREMEAGR